MHILMYKKKHMNSVNSYQHPVCIFQCMNINIFISTPCMHILMYKWTHMAFKSRYIETNNTNDAGTGG